MIDEQTTLAEEQHTTEEQGAPGAAVVEGPLELAARMGRRADAPQ
jgi:hypothetical protein